LKALTTACRGAVNPFFFGDLMKLTCNTCEHFDKTTYNCLVTDAAAPETGCDDHQPRTCKTCAHFNEDAYYCHKTGSSMAEWDKCNGHQTWEEDEAKAVKRNTEMFENYPYLKKCTITGGKMLTVDWGLVEAKLEKYDKYVCYVETLKNDGVWGTINKLEARLEGARKLMNELPVIIASTELPVNTKPLCKWAGRIEKVLGRPQKGPGGEGK